MNSKTAVVFASISLASCLMSLISIKKRRANIVSKAGSLSMAIIVKRNALSFVVAALCPAVIVLSSIISVGNVACFALCAAAALGEELAARDLIVSSISGVYENGVAGDGRYIPYKNIVKASAAGSKAFEVSTKTGVSITVICENTEQIQIIVDKINENICNL